MSSRISFIRQIYEIAGSGAFTGGQARYMEMGRRCRLSDYLDSHAANYLGPEGRQWEDNRPFPSGNGFIALSVEAGAAESGRGHYIPFFSIARNGQVDDEALREEVWPSFSRSDERVLDCPTFMNEFALDKIVFRLRTGGGRLRELQMVDLAAFDEDNDADMKGYARSFVDYLMQFGENSFLHDWCLPFLGNDCELWCDIRSLDRDSQYTAHSFYAVMLGSLDEIRSWHAAFGEELANVSSIVKSVVLEDSLKARQTEALKSAVSAIMARNLSHNLGSHYLYYTKAYLERAAAEGELPVPDIEGVAGVLSYIQARMDYIATLVSGERYPAGAVDFVPQIYEAFAGDAPDGPLNFLLAHIVMSENFTLPRMAAGRLRPLEVRLNVSAAEPAGVKLALPGGTMSCHAFFNILENFIRNSAKYMQEDFDPEGLFFTVEVVPGDGSFDFVISDNKHNAAKVLPLLEERLAGLNILDGQGAVDKSSKGLKEMLFGALWMRPQAYAPLSFAQAVSRIQDEKDPRAKLRLIGEWGFSFTATPAGDLALVLNLPAFRLSERLNPTGDVLKPLSQLRSDIVLLDMDRKKAARLGLPAMITRPYYEPGFDAAAYRAFVEGVGIPEDGGDGQLSMDAYRYRSIISDRFCSTPGESIDDCCLWMGDRFDARRLPREESRRIYFERHLSTKLGGLEPYRDYACVDSISGGNYTMELYRQFASGVSERGRYLSWGAYILGLRIKEAALTRITIVDERLYNRMCSGGEARSLELSCKNIRVLSADLSTDWTGGLVNIFHGNSFRDGSSRTHFLSIHLGLVEKLIQSRWGMRLWGELPVARKAELLMEELRRIFGAPGESLFISVHSGRGNFSKELSGPLAGYPFLSLSAVENAFSDSKFMLAQLFYSTVYIGKGRLNSH